GDERSFAGSEPKNWKRDFLRFGPTPQQGRNGSFVLEVLDAHPARRCATHGPWRERRARTHGVDANSEFCLLTSKHAGERERGRLAGVVLAHVLATGQRERRRNVDDAAAAALAQIWEGRPRAIRKTLHIRLQNRVPAFGRGLVHRSIGAGGGIVDEDVEASQGT